MRIKSLSLKNFRLFGENGVSLDFRNDKNVTILLGNNGSGKTSIVDAIVKMLSAYPSYLGQSIKQFLESDVHIKENNKLADYASVEMNLLCEEHEINIKRYKNTIRTSYQSYLKEIKNYSEGLKEKLLDAEDHPERDGAAEVELPIVAYYSTGRGHITAPQRHRSFQQVYNRWDCFKNALEADADFKRFFAWYESMEDEARRYEINELKRSKDGSQVDLFGEDNVDRVVLKSLQYVRAALEDFVGGKYTNPHIAIRPLRFVMNEVNNPKRELRIEQMSDGYKIIVAMVADIASRMVEANPQMENPLLSHGIVLIDEVDLHLHPKWQREILRQLNRTFPNVQFIVSTHSAMVVLGAADIAQVIRLNENKEIDELTNDNMNQYDVSNMLLSDFFEVDSVRTHYSEELLSERDKLLMKYELTSEDRDKLKELDNKIAKFSYVGGIFDSDILRVLQEEKSEYKNSKNHD